MLMPIFWMALGAAGSNMFQGKRDRLQALSQHSLTAETGVAVSLNCEVFEVVDPELAKLTFMRAYADARMEDLDDPTDIAIYIVKRYGPRCMKGDNVNSLGELEFYDETYLDVLEEMEDSELIDLLEMADFEAQHNAWVMQRSAELGG